MRPFTRASFLLAATAAGLAVATAAAAVLPGAANDTAREHTAGVTVPGPNAAAGSHPSGEAAEAVTDKTVKTAGAEDNHGATVSELARTTELTGREKGQAIAAVASAGRSTARGESAAAAGQAKAAEKSAAGQAKAAAHRP